MNAAALDAVAKARAEGMTFSKEGAKSVAVDRPKTEVTVTDKATKSEIVIKGKDIRQAAPRTSEPNTMWTGTFNGKTVKNISGATCFTRCKVSLAYHTCNTPSAVICDGTIIPVAILR
jgi:hypothetical protein